MLTDRIPAEHVAGEQEFAHLAAPVLEQPDGAQATGDNLEAVFGPRALGYNLVVTLEMQGRGDHCQRAKQIVIQVFQRARGHSGMRRRSKMPGHTEASGDTVERDRHLIHGYIRINDEHRCDSPRTVVATR